MGERVASLPMYDLPETAAATDLWWMGLAAHFAAAGMERPPARLTRPGEGIAFWSRPDLLFSQSCGYPLVTVLAGRVTVLGTPCYDAPGCDGPEYCSVILVDEASECRELIDLRGGRCAVNDAGSWSGHHVLRLMLATLGATESFCGCFRSGSHAASAAAVAEGRADFAAIDCVTHANLSRWRPRVLAGTRVLCTSPRMPGLPLIAGAAASPPEVAAMRAGLAAAVGDPELAEARKTLGIAGIHGVEPGGYDPILAGLRKAADAGVGPLI